MGIIQEKSWIIWESWHNIHAIIIMEKNWGNQQSWTKINEKFRPPPPQNQRWENGAFLPIALLHSNIGVQKNIEGRKNTSALERVQHKAAWFCSQNYNRYASVTDMIKDLEFATLETRRRQSRLTLNMYKLTHGLIDIDSREYLIQHSESRTRGSHQFKFRVPYANKDVFKFSFFSKNYSGLELPPWGYCFINLLRNFQI